MNTLNRFGDLSRIYSDAIDGLEELLGKLSVTQHLGESIQDPDIILDRPLVVLKGNSFLQRKFDSLDDAKKLKVAKGGFTLVAALIASIMAYGLAAPTLYESPITVKRATVYKPRQDVLNYLKLHGIENLEQVDRFLKSDPTQTILWQSLNDKTLSDMLNEVESGTMGFLTLQALLVHLGAAGILEKVAEQIPASPDTIKIGDKEVIVKQATPVTE